MGEWGKNSKGVQVEAYDEEKMCKTGSIIVLKDGVSWQQPVDVYCKEAW